MCGGLGFRVRGQRCVWMCGWLVSAVAATCISFEVLSHALVDSWEQLKLLVYGAVYGALSY